MSVTSLIADGIRRRIATGELVAITRTARKPTAWHSGGTLAQLLEALESNPTRAFGPIPIVALSPEFAAKAAAALRKIAPPDVGESSDELAGIQATEASSGPREACHPMRAEVTRLRAALVAAQDFIGHSGERDMLDLERQIAEALKD